MDPTYSVMALDTLRKALAAPNRHDRSILMEEAVRLHRQAVEAEAARSGSGGAPPPPVPRRFLGNA